MFKLNYEFRLQKLLAMGRTQTSNLNLNTIAMKNKLSLILGLQI
jgi:hypothetical protein